MSEIPETNEPARAEGVPRPRDPESPEPTPGPQGPWGAASAPGAPMAGENAAPASGAGGQPPTGNYPPPGRAPSWGYPPGGPWSGGPATAKPSRSPWYRRSIAVAAVVAATVGAGVGIGHGLWSTGSSTPAAAFAPGSSSSGSGSTGVGSSGSGNSAGPSDASSIAAKVDPALVDINVTFSGQDSGAGTGIVLTSKGEVLTNNHVVEGATSISVTDIGNGKTYGATVVGYDRTDDVAVIQLTNASGLQTAKMGNSSNIPVGAGVVAIGNAGGTGGTPTATGGSVTALNTTITASDEITGTAENLTGLIETNAGIQPGDSGGSLVNSSGQVIGMDTAASQGYSLNSQTNQGFAIPINKALSIASQIESGRGSSTVHVGPTAYLGVLISTSNSSTSPYPGGDSNTSGALISGVVSGSPAATAGLSQGDVITSIDGHSVTSASDLTALLQQYKPGDSVQVGWTDSSAAAHTTTITLGSGPAQ
jgi:S1-C subfamily serine protease